MNHPLAGDVNPLKADPDLQSLLKRLDKVKKYKTFQRWKVKFLDRLESFLYEKGMKPADKACSEFDVLLKKFVKSATKVLDFIEQGDLGEDKKTVKASLALNEMCKSLTTVCDEIDKVIPMKSSEEKKKGFNKFHLGATLIRQGFYQYVSMKQINDALAEIGQKLEFVADRQQHDLFKQYSTAVQRFCDVMADLNLYEVMLKCLEFIEAPDEDESSEEEPVTIQITIKTHDGKLLTLILDPMDTIGNVKAAIADGCGIVPDKQVLKFNNVSLNKPDDTLVACGINDGANLIVEPFMIPITVKLMDGTKKQLMIDPDDRLSDIKIQLEEITGLPAKNQSIYKNGEELSDPNLTATEYGIKSGAVLDLEPKVITVTINLPDGRKSISIQVKPTITAGEIKQMIAEETGMKVPRQVLLFNGKEMKNDVTLKNTGIQDGAELTVDIFKVPVTVNTMDGKKINVMIDPTEYLSDIKRQLEEVTGISAMNQTLSMNGQTLSDPNVTAHDYGIQAGSVLNLEPSIIKITVTTPDGKNVSIEVKPNDTSEIVKEKISEITGMTVPQQLLKYNGKVFADGKTIKHMGIDDGATLTVETLKVPVTVNTMDGRTIKVMIDPTDRISDIKIQLQDETGVSANNQKLSIKGIEMADLDKTAADYGITSGSVIDLEPSILKLNVKIPSGKTIVVEVKPSDTAETIKEKIGKQTGMNVPQQVLKNSGAVFANDKTVKEMGLQDGSDLLVEIFRVPVSVNTMDGKSIKVMIDPTDKISKIKQQLENECGVSADNQVLSMGGQLISDPDKSAADYGITSGSVLDMEPNIMTVNVMTPDGKTIRVEVKPNDTAEVVKAKIGKQTGMNVPQQIVKHNGNVFANGQTVKGMKIQDGSNLTVEIFKVPITVNTMDGKSIKVMIDPTDQISKIKMQLEKETNVAPKNQKLLMNGKELSDDNLSASEYGVKSGSVIDLEPKIIKISVETPDGKMHEIELKPSDKTEDIKAKIAATSGMSAPRQVLKVNGKELVKGKTVKELGLGDGTQIKVDIFKLPITVKTPDGKSISIGVEPGDTIDDIKKVLEKETGMEVVKQCLKLSGNELKGSSTVVECDIQVGSVLVLEKRVDPIIFVDIKSGTLFAVDRDDVIKKEMLTPYQNNKLDFIEAAKDGATKDRIGQAMKGCQNLGVSPQVVVTAGDILEYNLAESEKVKGVWGVSLKKREKNKVGEEFLFVDPKTGSCGELSRTKYVEKKFITPTNVGKSETIAEGEKDSLLYDSYIMMIRGIFGIKFQ